MLAERLHGVVINGDSMQVYADLRILTGRPPATVVERVPHRLYGVLAASERCSAGRWLALAGQEIEAARREGRLAIVVGGTGLYLGALLKGLAPVPGVPDAVRRAASARHAELGGAGMHAALAARDPATAERLSPADTQRLIRAWEVLEATGRPLSDWQREGRAARSGRYDFRTILLDPPRRVLYAACDRRFDAMLAAGALDEVRALAALGLDPGLPIMKALGVPELLRHLRGEISLAEAADRAKAATRRYAKRQVTWFRHQYPADRTIDAQLSESLIDEVFTEIRQFVLTRRK